MKRKTMKDTEAANKSLQLTINQYQITVERLRSEVEGMKQRILVLETDKKYLQGVHSNTLQCIHDMASAVRTRA